MQALEMAGVRAEELDMIICGTVTPDMPFPAAATFVQAKLGAKKAAAFDVSAACAGSLFALSLADSFIKTGQATKILVIGAELLTRIMDWQDRGTCVLFGDAAGAMVVAPETRPDRGILSTHLHTDGTQTDILCIPGGGSKKPFSPEVFEKREQFVKMNGREVFKTAVRVLEAVSREALDRNGYKPKDVTHVIATDGFTGNVLLKTAEGAVWAFGQLLKRQIQSSPVASAGALLMKSQLEQVKRRVDYEEVGGAPLLGVRGVAMIAHGRSTHRAILNALSGAAAFAQEHVQEHLSAAARRGEELLAQRAAS